MIKRFSILSALLVLATMGLAASAQAKPAIGIADQSVDTLKDPRFQKSGLKRYRIAVSYDQIRKGRPGCSHAPGRVLPPGQAAGAGRDGVLLPDLGDQDPQARRAPAAHGGAVPQGLPRLPQALPADQEVLHLERDQLQDRAAHGPQPQAGGPVLQDAAQGVPRRQVLGPDRRLPPGRQQGRRSLAEDVPEGDRAGPAPVGPDPLPGHQPLPRPSSRSGSSRTPSGATCT